jgi:hypothetical protein
MEGEEIKIWVKTKQEREKKLRSRKQSAKINDNKEL